MDLASALQRRDLAAAQAIVAASALPADDAAQWRAWLLFRAGDAQGALAIYRTLAARGGKPFDLHAAACLFQLRRYGEAQAAAELGPDCALKTRLLAHCASKLAGSNTDDSGAAADLEAALLTGGLDDRLSAAALRYGRCEYEAAGAIYEQLLGQFPDLHALHLYAALCAYMGDDWEASAASLAAYQREHPDSVLAANLRACIEFRAGGPAAALASLGGLPQQLPAGHATGALVRHNAVVFSGGQGALQVLPPLVDVVPEARLNLALAHCRRGEPARALGLLRGLEPGTALEHICKGVACALHGQAGGPAEALREAQECFLAVGQSPTELDSVPGRQCLASAALLGPRPEEAAPLLESVAEVVQGDDALSWNLGMARAAAGLWGPAAQALQDVQRPDWREDPAYQSWLARCLVRSGQPQAAWEVYVAAQARAGPAPAVADLLHLLAADCYLAGEFLAYHGLEFLQQQGVLAPTAAAAGGGGGSAVWHGKRAAVAAALREVAQGQAEAGAVVPELLGMLRGSANPQAHVLASTIRDWARQHAPEALPSGAA